MVSLPNLFRRKASLVLHRLPVPYLTIFKFTFIDDSELYTYLK